MYYYNTELQKEFTIEVIREMHPNVSIPEGANLDFIGYVKVKETELPFYDQDTQGLLREVQEVEGEFVRKWVVIPLPVEDVELKKAQKIQQIKDSLTNKVQAKLDNFAKEKGYDGILSACTYATDPDPLLKSEGQRCVELRSATWKKAYSILEDVLTGIRKVPESFEEINPELPVLTWENTNG